MKVKTTVKQEVEIDITPEEAFNILCKSLKMEFVMNEMTNFTVAKNDFGENVVWIGSAHDGSWFDDRGDLFVALRNVAVRLFPNVSFRNKDYIMRYGDG